jgi:hypothetical protein
MCINSNNLKQEPEYIILKSHEENGMTIVEEFKFTGISIVKEAFTND